MFNKTSFKEWFDRYKYSELAATSAALIASQSSHFYNGITTAYIVTTAEYVAFYGVMIFRMSLLHRQKNQKTTLKGNLYLIRNLFLEFGYPAGLDFLFIRPVCMYWFPILTGNYLIGIITGKIAADLFFYTFSIINYELIKKKHY
jgi:hypothetical protein